LRLQYGNALHLPKGNDGRRRGDRGARRFYERHGFRAIHLTDGRDNEEKMPDVRYRWQR